MKYIVTVNGKKYEVEVERADGQEIPTNPVQSEVRSNNANSGPAPNAAAAPAAGGVTINAPMPGTILDVKVQQGQAVKRGDVLFILEAMKMENEIVAPQDGVVASISASKGASVNTGDLLAVLN